MPPSPAGIRPLRAAKSAGTQFQARSEHELEGTYLLQVLVRDNNVDQALKALKKKMQREGIFREMKLRGHYEKPSEKKARERAEAIRRARKLARKKMQREGLLPDEQESAQAATPTNIASLTEVVQRNPNDAQAYNMRGSVLGRAGRNQEALADFDRAIAIDANCAGLREPRAGPSPDEQARSRAR